LVLEEEIAKAIRLILEHQHMLIEGAAALPVAALLKLAKRVANQTIVLIISGKRISLQHLRQIMMD
jgi:threonine dehydratase